MGCEGKEACAVRQPRAAASETRRVRGDAAVEGVLLLEVLLLERLPRRLVAVELGRTRAGGGGRAVRWACGFRREKRRRGVAASRTLNARSDGHHLVSSRCQLERVDLGTMMRWGPDTPRHSFR